MDFNLETPLNIDSHFGFTSTFRLKMRGKRSKQYRKLMQYAQTRLLTTFAFADGLSRQFSLTFGFRPPYQVLGKLLSPIRSKITAHHCSTVDAQMIQDSEAWKMDTVGGLERTLGDKVKPSVYCDCLFL